MPDDEDKRAILDRRARLIAVALSGLAPGCYEAHIADHPHPPAIIDASTETDAGVPVPCLGRPLEDAGFDAGFDAGEPQPCLEAPFDAGYDAGPMPCLDTVIVDAGTDAGAPMPCLTRAP